jgi:hypothetical protein
LASQSKTYEEIHLHSDWRRAARGMRAKNRNHCTGRKPGSFTRSDPGHQSDGVDDNDDNVSAGIVAFADAVNQV